jgi:hypothetical protein
MFLEVPEDSYKECFHLSEGHSCKMLGVELDKPRRPRQCSPVRLPTVEFPPATHMSSRRRHPSRQSRRSLGASTRESESHLSCAQGFLPLLSIASFRYRSADIAEHLWTAPAALATSCSESLHQGTSSEVLSPCSYILCRSATS